LRARVFANPFKNLEMLARTSYSRSDRIGDLLNRMFYEPSWNPEKRFYGVTNKQIELRELKLNGSGPKLVLNATCLNTGHNWRFEPTGMGEAPLDGPVKRVDRNAQLTWGYFEETMKQTKDGPKLIKAITSQQRDFPLGLAVAASGGFPGLVSPLSITGLYKGERVRLMDGGAHDNQGIESLERRNCTKMIVSDASGQLDDVRSPKSFLPLHLFRINSIYGDRVREEQLRSQNWEQHVLLDLHQGLESEVKPPLDDDGNEIDPPLAYDEKPPIPFEKVDLRAQERLAHIRTDLDAFNDVEADSLMVDGYLVACRSFPKAATDLEPAEPWKFMRTKDSLTEPTDDYLRKLAVAKATLFKPLKLIPTPLLIGVSVVLGIVALAVAIWRWSDVRHFAHLVNWSSGVFLGLVALATPIVAARLLGLVLAPEFLARKAEPRTAATARWAPIAFYLLNCALVVALAERYASKIAGWLDVADSRGPIMTAAALLLAVPALAPWLLALLWYLEGFIHRWYGHLPD
jgi:NTE family protein